MERRSARRVRKHKGSRKSEQSGQPARVADISGRALVYDGPTRLRDMAHPQLETNTIQLVGVAPVTSDGSGNIVSVLTSDPSLSGEWASLSGGWTEFRVLSMRIEYAPYFRYYPVNGGSQINLRPLVTVWDTTSSTALASYDAAYAYSSAQLRHLQTPWTANWKMEGVPFAEFKSLASVSSVPLVRFKLYSTGVTTSLTYGAIFIVYIVQFRGRQ